MTSANSLNEVGTILQLRGDEEGARLNYLAALHLDPTCIAAMANLATLLSNKNQLHAAAAMAGKICGIASVDPRQLSNYGNFLTRLERYEEARSVLERCLQLASDQLDPWVNMMLLEHRVGNQEAALKCAEQIEALGGLTDQIQNDRAHLYLGLGDLEKGLVDYEARWHTMLHSDAWDFHIAEWQGQSLEGKHILVHHEQGFGDTIMTSRFVTFPWLSHGNKITFVVPGALLELYKHQNWPVDVIEFDELDEQKVKQFDFHSPLYSMIRWLGIRREHIQGTAYLNAPLLTVPNVIPFPGFNIGICWTSGRRGTQMDWRRRVSNLEPWLALASIPEVILWSLNLAADAKSEIENLGAEGLIQDPTFAFESFAHTAAFIDKLDLVITVDTAIAHLAGALGKQVIMLAQYTPCWRWWDLKNGTGKPWYNSIIALRQETPNGWEAQLKKCLWLVRDMIAQRGAQRIAA